MTGIANIRELLSRNLRQSGIFIALVAIVVLFSFLNPNFLSPGTSRISCCSTPTS